MVLIPAAAAGPAGGDDGTATGAPFLLDRLEVTVGRFRGFCAQSGLPMPKQPAGSTERHPVVAVKWSDAVEYAAWSWRRLPREEEWERAARGPEALAYPWGNVDEETRRNGPGSEDGFPRLAPVGSYPSGASPDGALDMAGNVWEWCQEWNEPLRLMKIIRGGSWFNDRTYLRGSHRAWDHPDFGSSTIGFRCAVSVE
jgi:formylglycine-generating enzyme required for sulfatase activity